MINRCEVFDETDLDAALARFEELQPQTPRLENTASQVGERYRAYFAAGDWDAMAAIIADDFVGDDRRRVVGSGVRIGREAQIADMRAIADLFIANMTWTDIATRGDRLVLFRVGFLDRDQKPDAFRTEVLCVAEIDADERIVASVSFDLDDVDAAFEELDARYLAGEATTHARTWSVITGTYAAVNRHEVPATTPDWVMVDHRPIGAFEAGDLAAFLDATWDLTAQASIYIEAVHRLNDLGAVVTHAAHGTSQEGLEVEWRDIDLVTVDGDLVNRCEIFDEADIDAALARFEEFDPRPTTTGKRGKPSDTSASWRTSLPATGTHCSRCWPIDTSSGRSPSGGGRRDPTRSGCRDRRLAGDRRCRGNEHKVERHRDPRRAPRPVSRAVSPGATGGRGVQREVLGIVEIDTDERIAAFVVFDLDDIDAAFEELDARYLAGEAAAHSQTWSVIARAYAAMNRHELPATTPDWVNIDHRRAIAFAPGDATAYLRATWDLRQASVYVETVHRLSDLGAVFTLRGAWDLARGLRRRVAGDQRSDSRRRSDQPLRNLRRGRPRRRARPL